MKSEPIKDFIIDCVRVTHCYITPFNYKFDRGQEFLLERCITHGQPVDIDEFYLYFNLDDRIVAVWRAGRFFAYATRIYQVHKIGSVWMPVKNDAMFAQFNHPTRPSRKTLIAFDRIVSLYEQVQKEQRRTIIDAES